jgi:hypothetical protein
MPAPLQFPYDETCIRVQEISGGPGAGKRIATARGLWKCNPRRLALPREKLNPARFPEVPRPQLGAMREATTSAAPARNASGPRQWRLTDGLAERMSGADLKSDSEKQLVQTR